MVGPLSDLADRMAEAARELQEQDDPQATMEAAVRLAASNIPGCDGASISMVHKRRDVDTRAYSSAEVLRADELQYETGEGPCLDAIHDQDLVHAPHLADDDRWSTWGPRVERETGFRSVLCFRLFTHQTTVGALNCYSSSHSAFESADREEGMVIAAHIAVAVATAQKVASAEAGLHYRSVVGQAMGIIMERFAVGPDQAVSLLQRLSSHANVKLRDIAVEIVATRRIRDTQDHEQAVPPPRVG